MNPSPFDSSSRREFLKTTGRFVGASALAGVTLPHVHAAGTDVQSVALIGAGGRGTGAASNVLSVTGAPIKLVAVADVSEKKLEGSLKGLQQKHGAQVDVPPERRYIGFDGYQKAIDVLKPGDVAIFTTPCAFRPLHFQAAIDKGVNIFMEKPLCPDAPSARKMLELNKKAEAKGLKVAVGLMCRHCRARAELLKRIQDGAIGEITGFRTYRMQGPVASCFSEPRPETSKSELLWQIERFHSFLWLSGGSFSDYMIHNIDECCWMKGEFPVKAHGSGGRHYRGTYVDQNFDSYHVEYTFADGIRMMMEQRNMTGCRDEFASYVHGTKGMAIISSAGHSPAKCRIFKGHNVKSENLLWAAEQPEPNPYQTEWDDFISAIREDKPYNEVDRSVEASLACVMGRMACHTGQEWTRDEVLAHDHAFAPDIDKLTMDGPAPILADAQGKYPVPMPGITKKREY